MRTCQPKQRDSVCRTVNSNPTDVVVPQKQKAFSVLFNGTQLKQFAKDMREGAPNQQTPIRGMLVGPAVGVPQVRIGRQQCQNVQVAGAQKSLGGV